MCSFFVPDWRNVYCFNWKLYWRYMVRFIEIISRAILYVLIKQYAHIIVFITAFWIDIIFMFILWTNFETLQMCLNMFFYVTMDAEYSINEIEQQRINDKKWILKVYWIYKLIFCYSFTILILILHIIKSNNILYTALFCFVSFIMVHIHLYLCIKHKIYDISMTTLSYIFNVVEYYAFGGIINNKFYYFIKDEWVCIYLELFLISNI